MTQLLNAVELDRVRLNDSNALFRKTLRGGGQHTRKELAEILAGPESRRADCISATS
jgi:hypothetical protein